MNDSIEIVDGVDSDSDQEQQQNHNNNQPQQRIDNRQNNNQSAEEQDAEQLSNLQLFIDEEMENVKIEIQDSIIQYDWLIFEQHAYVINTKLSGNQNNNTRSVTRRFSDFDWLFQELLFKYPGYILPALPEKGLYSKVDPKIPYLNKIKNEFMDARKEMLRLFLSELLSHKELKYTKEVKLFLVQSDNQFQEEKERMINYRAEKEPANSGLVRNIYNLGLGVLNKAVGQSAVEKRKFTDVDDQFESYQIYYQKQYNKIKELNDCFSKIFEARKKQAENFQNVSDIFKEIKESQQINSQLDELTMQVGIKQSIQTNYLIKSVQIPLKINQNIFNIQKQYTEQLKNCLDILEFRKKLQDKIYQQEQEIKYLKQDTERQNEAINLNLKINEDKKRHKNFIQNFDYNQEYFKEATNRKIKELISEFNRLERAGAQKLLNIWLEKKNDAYRN